MKQQELIKYVPCHGQQDKGCLNIKHCRWGPYRKSYPKSQSKCWPLGKIAQAKKDAKARNKSTNVKETPKTKKVTKAKKTPKAKKVTKAKKTPKAKKVTKAKKTPKAKKVSKAKKVTKAKKQKKLLKEESQMINVAGRLITQEQYDLMQRRMSAADRGLIHTGLPSE